MWTVCILIVLYFSLIAIWQSLKQARNLRWKTLRRKAAAICRRKRDRTALVGPSRMAEAATPETPEPVVLLVRTAKGESSPQPAPELIHPRRRNRSAVRTVHKQFSNAQKFSRLYVQLVDLDLANLHCQPGLDYLSPAAHEILKAEQKLGAIHDSVKHALSQLEAVQAAHHWVDAHAGAQVHTAPHHGWHEAATHTHGFSVPYVKLIIVTAREFHRLMLEKTTMDRVVKHIVVEVGSVVVVAAVGKILGAAIGGLLGGPPGALIGGTLLGIIGGIFGSWGGRKINSAGFEEVYKAYTHAVNGLPELAKNEWAAAQRRQELLLKLRESSLRRHLSGMQARLKTALDELEGLRKVEVSRFCSRFPEMLERMRNRQQRAMARRQAVVSCSRLERWTRLSAKSALEWRFLRDAARAGAEFDRVQREYSALPEVKHLEYILNWLAKTELSAGPLAAELGRLDVAVQALTRRAKRNRLRHGAFERAFTADLGAMAQHSCEVVLRRCEETLRKQLARVEELKRDVIREGEALGLTFDKAA